MTPLNTTIEEEKQLLIDLGVEIDTRQDGDAFIRYYTLNDAQLEAFTTTARQRAYEAGRIAMGNEVLNSKEFKTLEQTLPSKASDI